MDSKLFLESQDLRKYDIIDIDTYGEPFDHFIRLKNNPLRNDLIVFLTYGFISQGLGAISNQVKEIIGIPIKWNLDSMYGEELRKYAISVILQGVVDCKQAIISNRIYYIGFKLKGVSCL
jgi:hypothetical protein